MDGIGLLLLLLLLLYNNLVVNYNVLIIRFKMILSRGKPVVVVCNDYIGLDVSYEIDTLLRVYKK